MSANFHAFQNRKFLFEGYEVIAGTWRERFTGFSPERIAGILNLETDSEYLYITYYGKRYRLRTADGILEKYELQDNSGEEWADRARVGRLYGVKTETKEWTKELFFNEAMAIYHILTYTKDNPVLSGTFIPAEQAEMAGNGSRKGPDPLMDAFARAFAGKTESLEAAAERLGGTKLDKGDVGYEFTAIGPLKLRMIFWDADEDFPAQLQILVDSRITDYIHPETIGCLIADLFDNMEEM